MTLLAVNFPPLDLSNDEVLTDAYGRAGTSELFDALIAAIDDCRKPLQALAGAARKAGGTVADLLVLPWLPQVWAS
jgi:hypothetical protein